MTIHQIYEKYSTPKNLQEHMLYVSALSKIITDNWIGTEINKIEVVKACSLHDIAKPIAFDLAKQSEYGVPENEIVKLAEFQNFVKNTYGLDEHGASVGMCRDIGLNKVGIKILDNIEWDFVSRLLNENDLESLISVYCDMRIGPKGIMNIIERIRNLQSRYKPDKYDYQSFEKNAPILEGLIQSFVSVDLNLITNQDLESLFSIILDLEI